MTTPMTAGRRLDLNDVGRIACAVFIVVCLSSAPYVALSRWVARVPLALDTWPYRYSYWSAAIVGFGLFVADVLLPLVRQRDGRSRVSLVALALPIALAVWTMLSMVWTDSPDRTRENAMLMALIVTGAIWLGHALTYRQQIISLFVALQSLTLVSVAAALALTSARFAEDDTWMGLFGNPNSLSPVAGLGIIAALGVLTLSSHESIPIVVALCVVVDMVAMVKADSATGWIALGGAGAAAGAVMLAAQIARRGVSVGRIRIVGSAVVAIVVVSIPWSIRVAAGIVGKDRTLSGRTEIWDYVLDKSQDHWFAGYGFLSFWDTEANRLELGERRAFTSVPDAAHSTFFDTLLYLGVIGLILLLAVVAFSVGRTWWSALGAPNWVMAWLAAVVTFALLENVTESMIAYHSIFWVLLVAPGFAAMNASIESARRANHIDESTVTLRDPTAATRR